MKQNIHLATILVLAGCGGGEATAPDPNAAPTAQSGVGTQAAFARDNGLELKVFDLNRDEVPDIFKFYRNVAEQGSNQAAALLVRKEVDINHDGRIDVIQMWNDKSERIEEHTDLDFDGRIDERKFYKNAELLRKEVDLNYDGTADVLKHFDAGKLSRIESDRDFDGRTDTWEYYDAGELDRIGTDNDGDGEVDAWEQKRKPKAPVDEVKNPAADAPPSDAPDNG